MAKVSELALVKVPVPLDVQAIVVKFVAAEAAVIFTEPAVEHIVIPVPAIAVALVTNVRILDEFALLQPAFVAISVRTTLPAVKSAALGV